MTKFICFGSGSSGNCYYLLSDGYGILIDQGIGIRAFKKGFRDYGLSMGGLKAILVTHDHTDHVKAVGAVSCEFHLPVYATECVHEGMQRNYLMSKKIEACHKHFTLPGETFRLGPFEITPFTVPHDSSANSGYFIQADDGITFCLLTDVGHFTEEMPAYTSRARYLVIESNYDTAMLETGPYPAFLKRRIAGGNGHIANSETAEYLAKNLSPNCRKVWLCHLSEENNHPTIALKTVRNAVENAPALQDANIQIEVLKRKTPSPLHDLD